MRISEHDDASVTGPQPVREPDARASVAVRLRADVAALSALGEKLPGTPPEQAACRFIADRLQVLGIRHRLHEFDAFIGWPTHAEVIAQGGEVRRFAANGIAFGPDTGAAGITGKLTDCRGGAPDGTDLAGGIALVDGMPRHAAIAEAARAGAVGVIAVSSGPQRHFVSASPLWGAPTGAADMAMLPAIPAVQVSRPDGDALHALCRNSPAGVTLIAQTRTQWRQACMPVADIPGREPLFLLIGAHLCTWAQGATDNVAGVALLLELARRFAEAPAPRYGLRLAWWTGHEQGAYAGSSWYADAHWAELHDHALGYLNVDIVGSAGAVVKAVRNTSAELSDYVTAAVERAAGPLPPEEDQFARRALRRLDPYVDPRRPARNSDQSFLGIGLSSLQVSAFLPAASPDHLPDSGIAWWWQTEQDTPERCDPAVLAADLDLHHALVEGMVNADRLPFDFVATADDILAGLRAYLEAAPDMPDLTALHGLAQRLRAAAARHLAAHRDRLDTLHLRLARVLNPVMFHAGSRFGADAGRASRLLPGLAPALELAKLAPDEARMARVALRRQANRIAHALRRAIALIEEEER